MFQRNAEKTYFRGGIAQKCHHRSSFGSSELGRTLKKPQLMNQMNMDVLYLCYRLYFAMAWMEIAKNEPFANGSLHPCSLNLGGCHDHSK